MYPTLIHALRNQRSIIVHEAHRAERNDPPYVGVRVCLVLSILSALALAYAITRYRLLPVDGGWYSYPAFALSLGREVFAHQMGLASAEGLEGLRALFLWDTAASVRTLYGSVWYRLFGGSFLTVQVLSLAELCALFASAHLLYRNFFQTRWLATLALLLIVTDVGIAMEAASDSRPDLALTAAACFLYVLMRRKPSPATLALSVIVAAATATIHLTSPIPIAFVLVSSATDAWRSGPGERRSRLGLVSIVSVVAVAAFFLRQPIFHAAFNAPPDIADPVEVTGRIFSAWSEGPIALLAKELIRWRVHFFVSNAPQFAALVVAIVAIALSARRAVLPERLFGPLLGLVAAVCASTVLNPHGTDAHILPLVPFTWLLLVPLEQIRPESSRRLIVSLVVASSLISFAQAARMISVHRAAGVSNAWLADQLAQITIEDRTHVIVGGTEFWPYFPTGRDVILLDQTRDPDRLASVSGVSWSDVHAIAAPEDYQDAGWRRRIHELAELGAVTLVADAPGYATIAIVEEQPNQ